MDVDCSEYYLPNLVISEIEDDDIDTMQENRAYVSIINEASTMALSVATVCSTTATQLDQAKMSKHITMIQSKLNQAIQDVRKSVETRQQKEASTEEKSRRLTEAETTPTHPPTHPPTHAPTKNPTKSPTLSPSFSPSDVPSQAPSEIPRVELQEYDETDPTQQFLLLKGSEDYHWIYSPYCSEWPVIKILMVPKGGSNSAGQLAELVDLDFSDWTGKLKIDFNE